MEVRAEKLSSPGWSWSQLQMEVWWYQQVQLMLHQFLGHPAGLSSLPVVGGVGVI